MLKIILLTMAFGGAIYLYATPGAPLHAFLHPAHYTTMVIAGQASFALIVCAVCIYIGNKIPFLD